MQIIICNVNSSRKDFCISILVPLFVNFPFIPLPHPNHFMSLRNKTLKMDLNKVAKRDHSTKKEMSSVIIFYQTILFVYILMFTIIEGV